MKIKIVTCFNFYQILLDGPGVLKFSDFGLSRVEGEDLDELFSQFADAGELYTNLQPLVQLKSVMMLVLCNSAMNGYTIFDNLII